MDRYYYCCGTVVSQLVGLLRHPAKKRYEVLRYSINVAVTVARWSLLEQNVSIRNRRQLVCLGEWASLFSFTSAGWMVILFFFIRAKRVSDWYIPQKKTVRANNLGFSGKKIVRMFD